MGAYLELKNNSGEFDLGVIEEQIALLLGVVVDETNQHLFSLSGGDWSQLKSKILDLNDDSRPEHRSPFIFVSDKVIKVGINWSDDRHGSVKRFFAWLLEKYDCSATDHDSYDYKSSMECQQWIEEWLPVE